MGGVKPGEREETEPSRETVAYGERPAAAGGAPTGDPLVGYVLAGREILRPLGRGGTATVYLARHVGLDQLQAVKIVGRGDDPRFVELLLREMKLVAGLKSPYIVRALDCGHDPGAPGGGVYFAVLEYVEGRRLDVILSAEGALEAGRALGIVRQLTAALEVAHGGTPVVYHRDLKPENVIIEPHAGGERARLLDFGIARLPHAQTIRPAGGVMGTPAYMAPEQTLGGGGVDGRCDLYALGVVLYEMLAGRNPFLRRSLRAVQRAHLIESVPPLADTTRGGALPAGVCELVHALLAKSPDERPATAVEVGRRLDALLAGEPAHGEDHATVGAGGENEDVGRRGWLGRARRRPKTLHYDDLKRAVFDAIRSLHRFGRRGAATLPGALRVTVRAPADMRGPIEAFLAEPTFDEEIDALLLNRYAPRLTEAQIPTREHVFEVGERFAVEATALDEAGFRPTLVVVNGDRAGAFLELRDGGAMLYLGRTAWHDPDRAVPNDLEVTAEHRVVSRGAMVVRRVGARVEVRVPPKNAAAVRLRRRDGRRACLADEPSAWVRIQPGDVIELDDESGRRGADDFWLEVALHTRPPEPRA